MVHLRLTGVSEHGRKLVLVSDARVEFTVDVDDCGEPGTADTFGIKTMSYSNGPSTLIGGNIQIHK